MGQVGVGICIRRKPSHGSEAGGGGYGEGALPCPRVPCIEEKYGGQWNWTLPSYGAGAAVGASAKSVAVAAGSRAAAAGVGARR